MKRTLALLMALLMIVPLFAACGKKESTGNTEVNTPVTEPVDRGERNEDAGLSVSPAKLMISVREITQLDADFIPQYANDSTALTFTSSDKSIATVQNDGTVIGIKAGTVTITVTDATGEFQETCLVTVLGTSTTLTGTVHMPPVDSQGNIGCCAHESVTYAQFTIAVSQYIHSLDPDTDWNPSSGELRYLFSPKYTYNFAGAGTEYAYNILKDHGCLTENYSRFYHQGESSLSGPSTAPYKETASWDVSEGLMDIALTYRLTDYEEIDYTGVYSGNLTTGGDTNLDLFKRVKAALTDGNAVVICGWSSYWNYGKISADGDIGKSGDGCIVSSANPNNGTGDGNHAVTIVGYDDKVEAKIGGITLKGAFQVLNSWGSGYQNDGCVWMMYDAFNTTSEFEILNNANATNTTVFTYGDDFKFMRLSATKNNILYTFTSTGSVTVNGKEYTTYSIFDPESKLYLGYTATGSSVQLISVSAPNTSAFTNWALIPYTDVAGDSAEKDYKDSYLLYACSAPNASLTTGSYVLSSTAARDSYAFASAGESHTKICMNVSDKANHAATEFTAAIQLTESVVSYTGKAERTSTIYRFSFIDWRTDIAIGEKGLRIEAVVSTTTRENFKIDLLRIDASGNVTVHRPWLFEYGEKAMHSEYMGENDHNKLSFSGIVEPTQQESGYFMLSYRTMGSLPENTDYNNFLWGIRITGYSSHIKSLKLIAPDGTVLSQISLLEEYNNIEIDQETKERGTKDYFFDLGNELRTFTNDGAFYMINAATNKYVGYKSTIFSEVEKNTETHHMLFHFTTDEVTGKFILYDYENSTQLDIYKKDIAAGTMVKMSNQLPNRENTQDWTLVNNADSTVSFYLTQYPEYYFGYDPTATGPSKYVLRTDKDSDYCKWILEGAGDTLETPDLEIQNGIATYTANKPEGYEGSSATLRVTGKDGTLVSETAVTFTENSVTTTVSGLKSGETYMFLLTDGKKDLSVNYIVQCP